MNNQEIKRITQVYNQYQEDADVQAQWSTANQGNRAILRERRRAIGSILDRSELSTLAKKRILEVGCGSGNVLAELRTWGATAENLYGVDLLPDRIEAAQQKHPDLNFHCTNGEQLPFPDHHFDLLLVFTIFSSILDPTMAQNVAREIDRVLTRSGAVLWYDIRYDNPGNPHVRGLKRQQINQLFPDYSGRWQTITLLPPLARRLGLLTPWLYPILAAVPPLRTHYLALLQPPTIA